MRLVNGCWTISIIGAEAGKTSLVPLYGSLYSHKSPDFRSENLQIRQAIHTVSKVYLGLRTKFRVLTRHVIGTARRLFGMPDFHFYALADDIREYLFGHQSGLDGFHNQWLEENKQLSLFNP